MEPQDFNLGISESYDLRFGHSSHGKRNPELGEQEV
jgi:hypothetical protein